ncbi:MAG: non-reducing end alpha-L-arabinofuranosidase family hydrolase, partial [Myxococcales bacterium]|nr:non-reducing end alpha-L-arabinofuranosidase family hydrolase [Myxococcales bacterium]
ESKPLAIASFLSVFRSVPGAFPGAWRAWRLARLARQWGFQYKTSKTPDDFTSWSGATPLISGDPTGGRGVGPIDQTIICDDTDCYIFFNDDAGGVYSGSMPLDRFPGTFSGITRIMDDRSIIFEGI